VGRAALADTATTATSAATAYSWIGGTVANTATFNAAVTFGGAVTFSGSATYVLSTNTVYTDNLIEIHAPPGGVGGQWTSNDGKDIGIRMHYYANGTDTNAALVLAQDTGMLEWYSSGTEAGNIFSGVYGGIKIGSALVIGVVTATTFIGALTGTASTATAAATAYSLANTGTTYVGRAALADLATSATTATSAATAYALANTATTYVGRAVLADTATTATSAATAYALAGGANGSLAYQTGAGVTGFLAIGALGSVLQVSTITGLAIWADIDGGIY
jgi:hypothetical protein